MRRSSSLVGTPSRRAATVARRGSGDMGISLRIVEAEFTAEHAYLVFDLHDDRQVAGICERVSGIFERSRSTSAASRPYETRLGGSMPRDSDMPAGSTAHVTSLLAVTVGW